MTWRKRVMLLVAIMAAGCSAARLRAPSTAAPPRAATLTIARLDPQGGLTPLAIVATVTGARNAVATLAGKAYLTDSAEGRILVVAPAVSP